MCSVLNILILNSYVIGCQLCDWIMIYYYIEETKWMLFVGGFVDWCRKQIWNGQQQWGRPLLRTHVFQGNHQSIKRNNQSTESTNRCWAIPVEEKNHKDNLKHFITNSNLLSWMKTCWSNGFWFLGKLNLIQLN